MDEFFWKKAHHDLEIAAQLLDQDNSPVQREQLLQQRALQLAETSKKEAPTKAQTALLSFQLRQEWYALDAVHVRKVARVDHITPLPCVPAFYRGVANIDGQIVTILDLMVLFEIPQSVEAVSQGKAHIIVVEASGLILGLYSDDVGTVTAYIPEELPSLPEHTLHENARAIRAVLPDGLIVLDIETLFKDERLYVDEEPR